MSRFGAVVATVIALSGGAAVAVAAGSAAAAAPATRAHGAAVPGRPARLTAAFERGARLGTPAALRIALHVDPRRAPSPVAELTLLYPASLGVTTSGLGLAACRRPASDFESVFIDGYGLAGCSPNAVLGRGTVRAQVRIDGRAIPELGYITVLTGPVQRGRLGLVAYVDGWRPFGAKLAYGGEVLSAAAPFGGALWMRLPPIPNRFGAVVALVRLSLAIGSRDITYYRRQGGRRVAYSPGGVMLPDRCPRGGFRFSARLRFEDGTRATATTTVRCPRPRAPR